MLFSRLEQPDDGQSAASAYANIDYGFLGMEHYAHRVACSLSMHTYIIHICSPVLQ